MKWHTGIADSACSAFDPGRLHLIILPTEACNLRCSYCYESHDPVYMAPWVVSSLKQLISTRAPRLMTLDVSWFGGEPLLALDTVREISKHIQRLAQKQEGLRVSASMTTNGVLLPPEVLIELAEIGCTAFQVTLDGPPAIHDRTRVDRRGNGTFQQIWRNLVGIKTTSADVSIILRIHYTPGTWRRLGPLLRMVRAAFAGDGRYSVLFHPVERLGGKNDCRLATFNPSVKEEVARTLEEQLDCPGLLLQERLQSRMCYAAHANSFVIRSDGTIAKCTVALGKRANMVGQLLPDGTLSIEQDRFRLWLAGHRGNDSEFLSCPWSRIRSGTSAIPT